MSREDPLKAEKDFTETLDEQFPKIEVLAKNDYLGALDKLLLLEKQTRQSSDLASSKRVLIKIVDLITENKDYTNLNEQITLLSKKHGQMKNSVQTMIQQVIKFLEENDHKLDETTTIEIIETIRTVTENKIYVEVERARVSHKLSDIFFNNGDLEKATKTLSELQVETYGSMELKEKLQFIIRQMELFNLSKDFSQSRIYSRKILVKSLKNFPELKVKFYKLLIEINLNDDDYLTIVQNYLSIIDLDLIKENKEEFQAIIISVIYFIILSPFNNLQSDLINKIKIDPIYQKSQFHYELIKSFTTSELMRWPILSNIYSAELFKNDIFNPSIPKGKLHFEHLKNRVIEHNLRVISSYYSTISLKRLNILLDLKESDTEFFISDLVNKGIIFAKINRPQGIVNFSKPKDSNDLLNDWCNDIDTLLDHIETIGHMITKEEMMNGIKSSA